MNIAVTAYHEKLKNGYTMGTDLYSGFHLIPYVRYKDLQKDEEGRYTLAVDDAYNVFVSHTTPMNSLETINKGIEYEVNLGRIEAIRTQININGAYMYMKKVNKKPFLDNFLTRNKSQGKIYICIKGGKNGIY